MSTPGETIDDLLKEAGTQVNRIRLGPGLVGNVSTVMIFAVLCFVGTAWVLKDNPVFALAAVCVEVGLVLFSQVASFVYARRHPDHALIGGSDLLKALEMQRAAKGFPSIPVTPGEGPPPIDVEPTRIASDGV